jgi:hypothetical protein
VGKLLRKMTEVVPRITGTGAVLNAMDELDRASRSLADLDAQLHRVEAPGRRVKGHRGRNVRGCRRGRASMRPTPAGGSPSSAVTVG